MPNKQPQEYNSPENAALRADPRVSPIIATNASPNPVADQEASMKGFERRFVHNKKTVEGEAEFEKVRATDRFEGSTA